MHRQLFTLLLTVGLLAACDKPVQTPPVSKIERPAVPPATASGSGISAWLGKWTGPEGTYLEVVADGARCKIAIRNLDGVRTFEAVGSEGGLSFERDGTKETIRHGSGKDTGMKWLQDKSNCLVVKAGEGYCRG